MNEIEGFENLSTIRGKLRISSRNLLDLTFLAHIDSVGNSLKLENLDKLQNLNRLEQLEHIGRDFDLLDNDTLSSITALGNYN